MNLFEKAKDCFWKIPILPDKKKEEIFYYFKGLLRGEIQGERGEDIYCQYIKNILNNQNYSNSFSICNPNKPQLKSTSDDPKIIAYYLPQYHPDPHNDAWWGKGSTEWTNVSKSVPQYVGQYQPRLPGELGFYDLRLNENIHRQIELAKFYGIYGFSFYYYWFNGVRLLDLPFNKFVNDKSIDFPFNICWVNESWTKQWEGASNVPLIEQDNTVESYQRFITSCVNLFTKDNYIKVAGKPVLSVYRPLNVPKSQEVISYWRDYVRKETGLDLYIIGCIRTDSREDYYADYKAMGFDACSEFAPGPQLPYMKDITRDKQFVCDKFFGKVYDYKDFVENKGYFQLKRNGLYRAVSPMWDNTARKKNKGMILDGATPELYKQWLIDIINETKKNDTIDDDIIFINAWNEWAEGTYLEPDLKWKYGYLEATKDAILACRDSGKQEMLGDKKLMIDEKKIGVIILNYNDSETTKKLCASIREYGSIDHIAVVDNCSADDSFAALQSLSEAKVDVIQSDKNGGYSYGNNFGAFFLIENYHIDVLLIANPDVEFSEAFLIQVVRDMGTYHVQAASGYMKMPPRAKYPIMNKKINTFAREALECTVLLKRFFPFRGELVMPNTGIQFVEWLPGSLFAIDAQVYQELHGLDARVFLFYEEQILGKKFLDAGYKMLVDTDISYFHNHSVSINKAMKRYAQVRQLFQSKYFFYMKYKHINKIQSLGLKCLIVYGLALRNLFYRL